MEQDCGPREVDRFQERMLERFLTQPKTASRDDMDYLLEKLDRVKSQARLSCDESRVRHEAIEREREWVSIA
jgi:hypothetical protein